LAHALLSLLDRLLHEAHPACWSSCMCCPLQAMDDANLKKSEIDEIVLVGGSTRIPKV